MLANIGDYDMFSTLLHANNECRCLLYSMFCLPMKQSPEITEVSECVGFNVPEVTDPPETTRNLGLDWCHHLTVEWLIRPQLLLIRPIGPTY